MIQQVGMNEFKSKLSEYLRRVKDGESFLITKHGRLVARLEPIQPGKKKRFQAQIDSSVAEWNGEKYRPQTPVARNRTRKQLSNIISEDRNQELPS